MKDEPEIPEFGIPAAGGCQCQLLNVVPAKDRELPAMRPPPTNRLPALWWNNGASLGWQPAKDFNNVKPCVFSLVYPSAALVPAPTSVLSAVKRTRGFLNPFTAVTATVTSEVAQ